MADAEEKDVKAWLDASRYDLTTARTLQKSRRYVYVLFLCQQSLEKLLKALITAQTKEFPPRIHNLVRLGELTTLQFSQEERELLGVFPSIIFKADIRPMSRRSRKLSLHHGRRLT